MKRKLLLLLFILCLLPATNVWAQTGTYTANGVTWRYKLEGSPKTATITGEVLGNTAFSGALNIPDDIVHGGTHYTVTKINDYAFHDYEKATTLSIPTSVTNIGEYAFSNCSGFTGSLSLPNVTTIKNSAFDHCGFTGSLSLPNVTTISRDAFKACSFTGLLSLPNVITIGNSAFQYCSSFTGSPSLPKVTTIGEYVFTNCSGFSGSLSLPNVTTIGNGAFHNCSGFTGSLSLPNVTTIGIFAFGACGFTGSLSLPKVTTIGRSAFGACGFTGSLSLPKVTTIGELAFVSCHFTGSLSLPNVITIGNGAFQDCSSFTGSPSLPNVTTIGNNAFVNCSGFTGTLSLPKVTTIGSNAFQSCRGFTGIFLPKTLTSIGSLAFVSCLNLEAVKFENGTTLTNITGYQHFLQCYNLQYIDMRGVTLPPGFIVSRDNAGLSLFMSVQPYTMIYLPATAPAAEANQENFVIGGACDKFVVYDTHYFYTVYHTTPPNRGCNYPIQQSFIATTAEYKGRNIAGDRYSSLYLPYPATLPDGMRAYTFEARTTHLGITHFRFTSVGDGGTQLEANKPYLVRIIDGSPNKQFGTDVNVQVPVTPPIASTEMQDTNGQGFYFGGTTENIDNATAAGMKAYNLRNNQWRPIRTDNPNGYIHSFRAYMRTTGAAPAKGFAIVLDDEDTPTGIDDTVAEDAVEQGNSPIYTLDGKLMGTDIDALPSGEIYIKNGKKFYKF